MEGGWDYSLKELIEQNYSCFKQNIIIAIDYICHPPYQVQFQPLSLPLPPIVLVVMALLRWLAALFPQVALMCFLLT
jgi:hypothetical protein